MIRRLTSRLSDLVYKSHYSKQSKNKAFLRTEKQINDQLYDSIFKESNYRDNTKRKRLVQARQEKEEDKEKKKIEK